MSVKTMPIISQAEISSRIRELQRCNALGEQRCAISELARQAGLDRSTIYQAANGHRIAEVSQIRLSRALVALANEQPARSTRLMHIRFGAEGPRLGFGIGPVGTTRR
jgi:hypothetical protein